MSRLRQPAPTGDADIRTYGATLPPGKLLPPQTDKWHQLIYAIEGAVNVRAQDISWVVPPHRAVWLPAGTTYELQLLGHVALRTLYIATHAFPRAPRHACNVNVSPLLAQLILHACAKGALRRDVATERRVIGLIVDQLEFMQAVPLQLPMPRDARARRLAELLRKSPADARTLPRLAKLVGASGRTLERAFAAEVGMTFDQWRRRLRMIAAIERLAAGATVTAAAFDCGYDSVSAFVFAFRRELGTTPGRWLAR